ncbi:hypothetical protein M427DRAFT_380394 [Gonapodya prolifera JEL478]|uniref:Uncharacterized protein n=1 Tax=Gonapodya prolifera (strain JEL478) TaxID=1344416 RepID=A0A139AVB7_GONPJ|nr:hypothetical protein M427DRAFT_380394 [Gonapodya prolifera JEL478]|eukprot:KXS20649.1 hypothetical protein M427DRAFT_380394 [Gonapodya prolifera JEL478]
MSTPRTCALCRNKAMHFTQSIRRENQCIRAIGPPTCMNSNVVEPPARRGTTDDEYRRQHAERERLRRQRLKSEKERKSHELQILRNRVTQLREACERLESHWQPAAGTYVLNEQSDTQSVDLSDASSPPPLRYPTPTSSPEPSEPNLESESVPCESIAAFVAFVAVYLRANGGLLSADELLEQFQRSQLCTVTPEIHQSLSTLPFFIATRHLEHEVSTNKTYSVGTRLVDNKRLFYFERQWSSRKPPVVKGENREAQEEESKKRHAERQKERRRKAKEEDSEIDREIECLQREEEMMLSRLAELRERIGADTLIYS